MLRRVYFILLFGLWTIVIYPVMAQECSSQDVTTWISQADAYYSSDQYERARNAYTCAIEVSDEQDAYAYQRRAVSKRILGLIDEAMLDINISIAKDPSQAVAYYIRGNIFLDFGDAESAITDYEQAMLNNYSSAELYRGLGQAYIQVGDDARAKEQFQLAIQADSEDGLAYSYLGTINFRDGELDLAIENFELGIAHSTGFSKSFGYLNRGNISYLKGDYASAIADYTAGISAYGDYADLYLARANAYHATQNPDANADYLRYIQTMQSEIIDLDIDMIANLFLFQKTIDIVEGRVYQATLNLSAGAVLTLSVSAFEDSDVDPFVLLLDAEGRPIIADDDSGSGEGALINRFTILKAGAYTLLVTHSTKGHSGQLVLDLTRVDQLIGLTIPYQLRIGEVAQIFAISNDGLGIVNLRSYPALGFDVLERLPSGTRVTIMNGPFKEDKFVWWQVMTPEGLVGWVVERIGEVQTLFPALEIGREVDILIPELNFRNEPTVNGELNISLYGHLKYLITVVDGPVEADGYTWWKVRLSDGREVWAVERVGNNQTMIAILKP